MPREVNVTQTLEKRAAALEQRIARDTDELRRIRKALKAYMTKKRGPR